MHIYMCILRCKQSSIFNRNHWKPRMSLAAIIIDHCTSAGGRVPHGTNSENSTGSSSSCTPLGIPLRLLRGSNHATVRVIPPSGDLRST